MYIKSIRIRNTITDVVMREIHFHQGTNLVVDNEYSGRHNKVGKTTFLKLIDVLMGANNRSYIYVDQETNSETTELRDIIVSKRVAAEMTLVQGFDASNEKTIELRADLFPRGHYYIDDTRMTSKQYREKLNAVMFGIDDNVPTFRQLINSFVRVSVAGDNDAFLKTLQKASNAVYRSVYNFLFNISDPSLDSKLSQLKREYGRVRESMQQYRRVNGVGDIEQQRQVLVALEGEYTRVEAQMDDLIDAEEYRSNRDAIADARGEYAQLTDVLSRVNYKLERNLEALESARAEKNRQADLALSRAFFDEVCQMLPEIDKTFEDMVRFNNTLCDNKIAYFEEVREGLLKERASVENKRQRLLSKNSRYLSLVANNDIDKYEELSTSLMQIGQQIGKTREVIDTLARFEEQLGELQSEINRYSTGGSARVGKGENYQEMMTTFNGFFTPLARRINGETPILVYSPDTEKFPVAINDISGSSTGVRKSLIAAYDLAYQQFAQEVGVSAPRFVVHDVVENIEGGDLRTIVSAANSIDTQFIVSVLKEKLDSSQISEEEQCCMRVLQLSVDDRIFEGVSVEAAEGEARSPREPLQPPCVDCGRSQPSLVACD